MKATRRPLPLSLMIAILVPTLLVLIERVGQELQLPLPILGAREYVWIITTATAAVIVFGIARLEATRKTDDRPGVKQVLEDLKRAEGVAKQTEDSVKELAEALREQGYIAVQDEEPEEETPQEEKTRIAKA